MDEDRRASRDWPITGVVLAGGAGRRMGGRDKGFVPWRGEPLIVHALRLFAGLPEVVISANRSLARYQAFGHTVVGDERPDFPGPLIGLDRALAQAQQPWAACVPVDSPCLPADLITRLWRLRLAEGVVVARSARGVEPLVCLIAPPARAALSAYIARGGRTARAWFADLPTAWLSLTEREVTNCNTPEDLADGS